MAGGGGQGGSKRCGNSENTPHNLTLERQNILGATRTLVLRSHGSLDKISLQHIKLYTKPAPSELALLYFIGFLNFLFLAELGLHCFARALTVVRGAAL